MKVLYVNHTGMLGGAEHSLLTLLEGLPDDIVAVVLSLAGMVLLAGGGPATVPFGRTNVPYTSPRSSLRSSTPDRPPTWERKRRSKASLGLISRATGVVGLDHEMCEP